jgi:hypothetical protein
MVHRESRVLFALLLLAGCRQLVGIESRQFDAGVSPTPFPACGLETWSAACASCISANCCTQAQQCVDDVACSSAEGCVQATCAAGDSACRLACSNRWEPVNAAQVTLRDCRQQNCVDACGPWDCLGNVTWRIPNSVPAQIKIGATVECETCSSVGAVQAIAGVHVRVCSMADPECKAELTHGDSDQNGKVTLMLPLQETPASVYLEFHKEGWQDDLLLLNTPPLSYDFDVGDVKMETLGELATIASNIPFLTTYDPNLAVVKLRVSNCNLQSSAGVEVFWDNTQGATIGAFDQSEWNIVAMNLPIPANDATRVVARLMDSNPAVPQDAGTGPLIASVNLVVRPGAVTLAPFVTPTP